MLTDLIAGRLQAAAVGAPALLQFIKAGRLRCIATGTSTRLPQLPDVPTVAEQGYKGFEMTQWYGLLAPSKMAKPKIDQHIEKVVSFINRSLNIEVPRLVKSRAFSAVATTGEVDNMATMLMFIRGKMGLDS